MRRIALLTLAAGLLVGLPAVAAAMGPIDPVPLMNVKDMKELPGALVPVVVPPRPKPCAPLPKGELTELPGSPIPIVAPWAPCYLPVIPGGLQALPGTLVPVALPKLPPRR